MEIYVDKPRKSFTEGKIQMSAARTPLLDVQNLTRPRPDPEGTPKRLYDTHHSRRSRTVEVLARSSSSAGSVSKPFVGATDSVPSKWFYDTGEIEVGAEISLNSSSVLRDSSPLVLPLEPKHLDSTERQRSSEQVFNPSPEPAKLHGEAPGEQAFNNDHTYLASESDHEVHQLQGIRAPSRATSTDKCVGTETDDSGAHTAPNCVDASTDMEDALTLDCSVLAVPDFLNQETMTEMNATDTASSMTPFKLGKHGSRLTAEEVRRQHPRVVANQIETVMVSNQRLEREAKAFARERSSLKSALKEITSSLKEHEGTISSLEASLEEKQQRLNHQEQLTMDERMKCWHAEETLQTSTSELQRKCQDLEKMRQEAEISFAEELQRIQIEAEEKSYKQQFESAQQKIRELQQVENEYTQLISEVCRTYDLQDNLQTAVANLKEKAHTLGLSNVQLKDQNENLKKRCVSKEVDLDVVRYLNQELLSDNEKLNSLLAQSNECIAELEMALKATNGQVAFLQTQVSEQSAEIIALAEANEELRRSKAVMLVQLSEQQDSETVALEALEEAEDQLRRTEEALAKERAVLAAGKEMHEKMKASLEEKNLKLEMQVEHLDKLLEKSELKQEAQEQELYECRENLYSMQDLKSLLEESTLDVNSGVSALQTLQEQMEALLATLHRKLNVKKSRYPVTEVTSSTPKKKEKRHQKERRSFVAQVLSNAFNHGASTYDTASSYMREVDSADHRNTSSLSVNNSHVSLPDSQRDSQHRQQSNVEFGATCREFGQAAAALLSPHSQSFCGATSHHKDPGINSSSRKSVSFCEGSRRELFVDRHFDSKPLSTVGDELMLTPNGPVVEHQLMQDVHTTSPGFAKIKSIPSVLDRLAGTVDNVANNSRIDHERGFENSPELRSGESPCGSSLSLSEKVMELAQIFRQIIKSIQLVERASQLTIKDLQDELHFVKEQLKLEQKSSSSFQVELEKKSESLNTLNARQKELQNRVSEMTSSLLNFHDQGLQISRLEEEKRDMKWKISDLEGQCSLLSDHLEAVVKKLDVAMTGQPAYDGVCVQEVLALKREKHDLMMQLFRERDRHKDLGDKAVERMKILESNWKKAENEVGRLDELIEEVRESCVTSQAQNTHPLILGIVRLIDGKVTNLNTCSRSSNT